MTRFYSLILAYFLLISFASGREPNHSVALGLSVGTEAVVSFYTPGSSFAEYNNNGIFTIGLIESTTIDNVDIFLSQYYSHVSISKEYQSNYHVTYTDVYTGSYLVLPIGIDIRLSKNKNNYVFLSGAYRLEFVFNQEKTDGIQEIKEPKFSLARQTFETGMGLNFRLSDAVRFKLKTQYVFKPFYNENILLSDVTDSRIKVTISVLKYF